MSSEATSSASWSIAIKTVGSRIIAPSCSSKTATETAAVTNATAASTGAGECTSFTLQVNPNDPLHSLSTKIESITGLPPNEQRLIYRGRIVSVPANTNDPPQPVIRDICGLSDGETIHLVPRAPPSSSRPAPRQLPFPSTATSTASVNSGGNNASLGGAADSASNTSTNNGITTTSSHVTSVSGIDGMNLLAALLGLTASDGNSNTNNNNNPSSAEHGIAGSAQGLGGIVSRAAMMGVLDAAAANFSTVTAATSADSLVASAGGAAAAAAAAAASAGGSTTTLPPLINTATLPGLLNRSVDEIRSSRSSNNNINPIDNSIHLNTASIQTAQQQQRNNRRNYRATSARLTASDIRIPDPGSMEPVRQGLMTLHTLLGNALLTVNDTDSTELDLLSEQERRHHFQRLHQRQQQRGVGEDEEKGDDDDDDDDEEENNTEQERQQQQHYQYHHPLDAHRQWYRGQWLDALDTVNQWLEATIVDIVLPSDLLGSFAVRSGSDDCDDGGGRRRRRRRSQQYFNNNSDSPPHPVEAVVSANDLEGRRRLLLEPRSGSASGDHDEQRYNNSMGVYDLLNEGYRPRNDNDGVQLLLIHYNGWPHRWDEWIRSDSPRIRPFRTRTRHRVMSSHASPTPQAVFQAAPSTFISAADVGDGGGGRGESSAEDDNNEAVVERASLLPELQRVISSVNNVLMSVLPSTAPGGGEGVDSSSSFPHLENDVSSSPSSSALDAAHLPWRLSNHGTRYSQVPSSLCNEEDDDDIDEDSLYNNTSSSTSSLSRPKRRFPPQDPRSRLNAAQLRQLAPLFDRLGRTLTDAAPHIAALADALPPPPAPPRPFPSRRPQVAVTDSNVDQVASLAAQASHLYFGIDTEDDNNITASPSATTTTTTAAAAGGQVLEDETAIDPDHTDFINGMVNTTRGGSLRDNTTRDPISPSLLASYLSSLGAGGVPNGGGDGGNNNDIPRVVRVGGGDGGLFGALADAGAGAGPGIDIHIHAIVTGPGMNMGGLGGLVDGGGTLFNRNSNRTNASTTAPVVTASPLDQRSSGDAIDGDEIDLFSDLYSESPPPVNLHQRNDNVINGNRDSLSQIFEECHSIEEEDEECDSVTDSVATQPFTSKVATTADLDHGEPTVEEGEANTLVDSDLISQSNDTSAHSSPNEARSSDTSQSPPSTSRRSTSSFGSRMYRRTIGRLSSRRFSES